MFKPSRQLNFGEAAPHISSGNELPKPTPIVESFDTDESKDRPRTEAEVRERAANKAKGKLDKVARQRRLAKLQNSAQSIEQKLISRHGISQAKAAAVREKMSAQFSQLAKNGQIDDLNRVEAVMRHVLETEIGENELSKSTHRRSIIRKALKDVKAKAAPKPPPIELPSSDLTPLEEPTRPAPPKRVPKGTGKLPPKPMPPVKPLAADQQVIAELKKLQPAVRRSVYQNPRFQMLARATAETGKREAFRNVQNLILNSKEYGVMWRLRNNPGMDINKAVAQSVDNVMDLMFPGATNQAQITDAMRYTVSGETVSGTSNLTLNTLQTNSEQTAAATPKAMPRSTTDVSDLTKATTGKSGVREVAHLAGEFEPSPTQIRAIEDIIAKNTRGLSQTQISQMRVDLYNKIYQTKELADLERKPQKFAAEVTRLMRSVKPQPFLATHAAETTAELNRLRQAGMTPEELNLVKEAAKNINPKNGQTAADVIQDAVSKSKLSFGRQPEILAKVHHQTQVAEATAFYTENAAGFEGIFNQMTKAGATADEIAELRLIVKTVPKLPNESVPTYMNRIMRSGRMNFAQEARLLSQFEQAAAAITYESKFASGAAKTAAWIDRGTAALDTVGKTVLTKSPKDPKIVADAARFLQQSATATKETIATSRLAQTAATNLNKAIETVNVAKTAITSLPKVQELMRGGASVVQIIKNGKVVGWGLRVAEAAKPILPVAGAAARFLAKANPYLLAVEGIYQAGNQYYQFSGENAADFADAAERIALHNAEHPNDKITMNRANIWAEMLKGQSNHSSSVSSSRRQREWARVEQEDNMTNEFEYLKTARNAANMLLSEAGEGYGITQRENDQSHWWTKTERAAGAVAGYPTQRYMESLLGNQQEEMLENEKADLRLRIDECNKKIARIKNVQRKLTSAEKKTIEMLELAVEVGNDRLNGDPSRLTPEQSEKQRRLRNEIELSERMADWDERSLLAQLESGEMSADTILISKQMERNLKQNASRRENFTTRANQAVSYLLRDSQNYGHTQGYKIDKASGEAVRTITDKKELEYENKRIATRIRNCQQLLSSLKAKPIRTPAEEQTMTSLENAIKYGESRLKKGLIETRDQQKLAKAAITYANSSKKQAHAETQMTAEDLYLLEMPTVRLEDLETEDQRAARLEEYRLNLQERLDDQDYSPAKELNEDEKHQLWKEQLQAKTEGVKTDYSGGPIQTIKLTDLLTDKELEERKGVILDYQPKGKDKNKPNA